jgi:ABC-type iron transport system FetAB permease component
MRDVLVRTPEQLAAVARIRPLWQFMAEKRLVLQFTSLDDRLQQAAERRLNFWLSVCGCQAGALFFLTALVWQIAQRSHAHAPIPEAVLLIGGTAVAAGIVGKAAAILAARAIFLAQAARFIRTIRRESPGTVELT